MNFNPLPFLEAKRDGCVHGKGDLERFVEAYGKGEVSDYQVSAWLMAVYFQGLGPAELKEFTLALAHSGEVVNLPPQIQTVDKHSTGGVGDKTTLILAPLVASCGVSVAKLSGRGLGFTGGTVDKLEAIPGFKAHLDLARFVRQVENIGCAISGHSLELAPAEGWFYSLRDVTATVPSLPLIASSIVSKKIAGGAKSFVFDVKCGSGAFMRDRAAARRLAEELVRLSLDLGHESMALVTDMDQPLGAWVGNAAEVNESFQVLSGEGPADTTELCLRLGGAMLLMGGAVSSTDEGRSRCGEALESGRALDLYRDMVRAQDGDVAALERGLPMAGKVHEVPAGESGWITGLDARSIGDAVKWLGGGRIRKEDTIDPGVAVQVLRKKGDKVEKGEPVLRVFYGEEGRKNEAFGLLAKSLTVGDRPERVPLVLETVRAEAREEA